MSESLNRLFVIKKATCSTPKCRRLAYVRVYGKQLTKPLWLCKRCFENEEHKAWLDKFNLKTERVK